MFYNLGLGKVDQIKRKGSLNSESFFRLTEKSVLVLIELFVHRGLALYQHSFFYNLIISIISSGLVVKIVN